MWFQNSSSGQFFWKVTFDLSQKVLKGNSLSQKVDPHSLPPRDPCSLCFSGDFLSFWLILIWLKCWGHLPYGGGEAEKNQQICPGQSIFLCHSWPWPLDIISIIVIIMTISMKRFKAELLPSGWRVWTGRDGVPGFLTILSIFVIHSFEHNWGNQSSGRSIIGQLGSVSFTQGFHCQCKFKRVSAQALEKLGADRIVQGFNVLEDPSLYRQYKIQAKQTFLLFSMVMRVFQWLCQEQNPLCSLSNSEPSQ